MTECAFDLALEEWADREWNGLADTPEFEISAGHERAMKRIFRRYDRNTRKLRPHSDVKVGIATKKVLIAVLAVFLALIAGCAATYFISHSFNSTVYADCVEVYFYNGIDNCPVDLENTYYLSGLSEDYEIIQKNCNTREKSAFYRNTRTGELIMFKYSVKSKFFYPIYLDTENGRLSEIEINGSYGLYLENGESLEAGINNLFRLYSEDSGCGNINSLIWGNGDYVFEIYSDLPKKDIIDLAKSTKVL